MATKPDRQRRERLSARVDPDVAELVVHVAEAERRPLSSVVRNILNQKGRNL
jgi:uncharacterized protein (DUF1778 family)